MTALTQIMGYVIQALDLASVSKNGQETIVQVKYNTLSRWKLLWAQNASTQVVMKISSDQ